MSDRHVRRLGDDYAEGLANLLPHGRAWPRDPESVLMRLVAGLAEIWGSPVDSRAADLLETESDPRATLEMLEDWERNFGLPDECIAEPLTIADRRAALVSRMTTQGGASPAYFVTLAASIGYEIEIREYTPFMCGISRVGDTQPTGTPGETYRWQIGPSDLRFYWTVKVTGLRVSWFRVGSGRVGVDPMVRISLATDLECLLRRFKPAHTAVIFNYDDSEPL
jgi:uncharacterized protein YmfQ (DUF2313 family)